MYGQDEQEGQAQCRGGRQSSVTVWPVSLDHSTLVSGLDVYLSEGVAMDEIEL